MSNWRRSKRKRKENRKQKAAEKKNIELNTEGKKLCKSEYNQENITDTDKIMEVEKRIIRKTTKKEAKAKQKDEQERKRE